MRRGLTAGLLATASACVGFTIRAPDECATTCQRAADCGFLPSALGWSADGSSSAALADCERRCANSPASDAEVAQIVACFASEETTLPRWCVPASEDDAEYAALWDRCAAISACISREHRDEELRGDVALTVQMIEWSEYQVHLGLALADYPASQQGDARAIQSCEPALCSPAVCSSLQCEVDADCLAGTGSDTGEGTGTGADEACSERCELPDGEVCDTRLCRVGHLSISGFCEELAARKISLRVYERDRLPVVEVFVDVEAGINTRCEASTLEFKPDDYELSPGPIKVVAMVEGELAGATLAEFGYFADGEVFEPAAVQPYCLEFIGPAVTVRAGAVEAVVPVADLVSLTKTKGTLWRRCGEQ
jgi:hypothetical protein